MNDKKVLTKRARRSAKKAFAKKPHSTRPFSAKDYENLPKGGTNA